MVKKSSCHAADSAADGFNLADLDTGKGRRSLFKGQRCVQRLTSSWHSYVDNAAGFIYRFRTIKMMLSLGNSLSYAALWYQIIYDRRLPALSQCWYLFPTVGSGLQHPLRPLRTGIGIRYGSLFEYF